MNGQNVIEWVKNGASAAKTATAGTLRVVGWTAGKAMGIVTKGLAAAGLFMVITGPGAQGSFAWFGYRGISGYMRDAQLTGLRWNNDLQSWIAEQTTAAILYGLEHGVLSTPPKPQPRYVPAAPAPEPSAFGQFWNGVTGKVAPAPAPAPAQPASPEPKAAENPWYKFWK